MRLEAAAGGWIQMKLLRGAVQSLEVLPRIAPTGPVRRRAVLACDLRTACECENAKSPAAYTCGSRQA